MLCTGVKRTQVEFTNGLVDGPKAYSFAFWVALAGRRARNPSILHSPQNCSFKQDQRNFFFEPFSKKLKKWAKSDILKFQGENHWRVPIFSTSIFGFFNFWNFASQIASFLARAFLKIKIFQPQNVQKCDFEISVRKLLTRPYVFEVDFNFFPFSFFCFRNCVFWGVPILEIAFFSAYAFGKFKAFRVLRIKISRFQSENRWRVPMFSMLISRFVRFWNCV